MKIEFEFKDVPDHIIEEVTVLRTYIEKQLYSILLENDPRIFFSAFTSAIVSIILENFHDSPETIKSFKRSFDSFFSGYSSGEFDERE